MTNYFFIGQSSIFSGQIPTKCCSLTLLRLDMKERNSPDGLKSRKTVWKAMTEPLSYAAYYNHLSCKKAFLEWIVIDNI